MEEEIKLSICEQNKINDIFNDYLGRELFNIETIEGIKIHSGSRVYGLRWEFVKLYYNNDFLSQCFDGDKINIINSILYDFICYGCENDSFIQEIAKRNLLTKEYIELTSKNTLFKFVFDNSLNITEMRHKLIKEKRRERYEG